MGHKDFISWVSTILSQINTILCVSYVQYKEIHFTSFT